MCKLGSGFMLAAPLWPHGFQGSLCASISRISLQPLGGYLSIFRGASFIQYRCTCAPKVDVWVASSAC